MSKMLNVNLNGTLVGKLEQDRDGRMSFTYVHEWLENPHAHSVSCSLPLRKETFTQKECRPFFAGLLPESTVRQRVAKNLGISENNDFSMLDKIGGECAGALTLFPAKGPYRASKDQYRALDDREVIALIDRMAYQPLLAGEKDVRLSMAGVQDKMPVAVFNGKLSIPLDNAPSTHIVKPINIHFNNLHHNEAFCMSLAREAKLHVAKTEIKNTLGTEYLLIERYDRVLKNGKIERLHQEDFCQALGIIPERKYQSEGGPSLQSCFNLIRDVSKIPALDLERLLESVIFNVLIGNCDAHGKNVSLLYQDGIELAPLYDLVSTEYYEGLSTNMAMKIGKEYSINKVDLHQFELLAEETGFSRVGIRTYITNLVERVLAALDTIPIHNNVEETLSAIVRKRCITL